MLSALPDDEVLLFLPKQFLFKFPQVSTFLDSLDFVVKIVKTEREGLPLSDLACASFRVRLGNEEIQNGTRDFLYIFTQPLRSSRIWHKVYF